MSKFAKIMIILIVFTLAFACLFYSGIWRNQGKGNINNEGAGYKGSADSGANNGNTGSKGSEGDTNNVGHLQDKSDAIKEQISKMTLDEKLGQMVLMGFEGYTMDNNTKQLIEKYHVGGFILFKNNIRNSKQLLELVNSLKKTNSGNKAPLFLSVDEEGGRVTRLPDELVKTPDSASVGKKDNANLAFNLGNVVAQKLKAFGLNVDFAPVLDINSNPKNPVIGDRSFGTNADIVSRMGIQSMKGIQSENILSVVKHFPGHGDTSVDSHIGLPLVNNSLERLKSFELVPFEEAINNGADAVMVAHILLPKIDPVNPASFSKIIITDLLRKYLGFNGVVLTDDMTMGAIVKNYDIGTAAVKSVNAGTDIVLVCHEYDKEMAVLDALKAAVLSGTLTEKRIDESVLRILKLKEKYGLSDKTSDSVDVDELNRKVKSLINRK
jgi:beta-N-acetylhexosaminidase